MEMILMCAIYGMELIWMRLGLRLLFEVKARFHKAAILIGVLCSMVVVALPVYEAGKNVIITLLTAVIVILSVEEKMLQKIVKLALVFIFLSCFDEVLLYIGTYLFRGIGIFDLGDNVVYLMTKFCTVFCVKGISNVIEKRRLNAMTHIESMIYLIIGIIAACMMLCLGMLNYIKDYFPNSRFAILCNIFVVTVYISIFLLVLSVIYIKNTHERMEWLLKTEELLKEAQVSHYRQLLKKEENTRSYRHDMSNHLLYMQGLLQRKKVTDAERYLKEMIGNFRGIQNTYYVTGNEMVDAIMNYFLGMLPGDACVEIMGKCPVEFDISDTDICTIFSNLFENAVEEITENHIRGAKIEIRIEKGKEYAEYQIGNTLYSVIEKEKISRLGLPITGKKDKKNHGIGLANVAMAVERNHGKFSWNQRDGMFVVKVILPIKTTV